MLFLAGSNKIKKLNGNSFEHSTALRVVNLLGNTCIDAFLTNPQKSAALVTKKCGFEEVEEMVPSKARAQRFQGMELVLSLFLVFQSCQFILK